MMMMSIRGQDTCTWWWRYCPPHHRPSLLACGWSKNRLKLTSETLNLLYRSAIVIERIENIRKIQVYKKFSHRSAIVTGWGRTSERSRPASVLREVSVRWFSFYCRFSKSDASNRPRKEHWQYLNLFSRCPSCQTSNARRCTGISHLQVFTADSYSNSIIVHFHSFFQRSNLQGVWSKRVHSVQPILVRWSHWQRLLRWRQWRSLGCQGETFPFSVEILSNNISLGMENMVTIFCQIISDWKWKTWSLYFVK